MKSLLKVTQRIILHQVPVNQGKNKLCYKQDLVEEILSYVILIYENITYFFQRSFIISVIMMFL